MSKAIIDLKEMANKEDQLFRAAPLSRANDLHNSRSSAHEETLLSPLGENGLKNLNKYFPHNGWQEIHPPIETPYTTNSCANGPLFRGIHLDPRHLQSI